MMLVASTPGASVPLWVVILVGVAGAAATLAVAVMGRIAQERSRRRDMYAEAVKVLIAWIEYPYQVRRRTSNDPKTLGGLADVGHRLQRDLAYYQTWLAADKPSLGKLYGDVVARIKERCGPPLCEAWSAEPVSEPSAMVLGEWGPGDCSAEIDALRRAIVNRFGWRRLRATFGLRQPRLQQQDVSRRADG
jgi:hypothetical protein